MKTRLFLSVIVALTGACTWAQATETINDGTTTSGLTPVFDTEGEAQVSLEANASSKKCIKVSGVTGANKYRRVRAAIYSDKAIEGLPESGKLYTVSARYKNTQGLNSSGGYGVGGGVLAWYNVANKIGIGLTLDGNSGTSGMSKVVINSYDFSKGHSNGFLGKITFRNMDGSLFNVPTREYNRNVDATCSLTFLAADDSDKAAWAEAVTKIEATVQVEGEEDFTFTFLSNLPSPEQHRIGYIVVDHGVSNQTNLEFEYGFLDDLTLEKATSAGAGYAETRYDSTALTAALYR